MLGIWAYLPIPKKSKKWMAAAMSGEIRPIVTPDLDNLLKHIKDCCKGIFWSDDKQVVGYLPETGKYYGSPPRWVFELVTLDEYRAGLEQRYADLLSQALSKDFVITLEVHTKGPFAPGDGPTQGTITIPGGLF